MRPRLALALSSLLAAVPLPIATAGLLGGGEAVLVAYWAQNDNDLPGGGFGFLAKPDAFPQAADEGVGGGLLTVGGGLLDATVVNGNGDIVYQWIPSFGGTTINALEGYASGGSISIQGGTVVDGVAANDGGYIQFAFDMTGLRDLAVSYATQRTNTGFTSQTWSYSTDGVEFTPFQTIESPQIANSFVASDVIALDTLDALDGVATAFLRVTLDGATGPTGNNRFDNILLVALPSGGACVGDLNDDDAVNGADLAILLGAWGPCKGCAADLNGDGAVNGADLAILLGAWGPCP